MKDKIYKIINNFFWELGLDYRFNLYLENETAELDILDQDLNIINSIYLETENLQNFKINLYERLEKLTNYL